MKKLILISGPSCVGKGPLLASLKKYYPEMPFSDIPVIRSHGSRNGKPRDDYEKNQWNNREFFMPDAEFASLGEDFLIGDCRGYPQAINLRKITDADEELLILEVYHTFGEQLKKRKAQVLESINAVSVFISPISLDEIDILKKCKVNVDSYIFDMMLNKQMRRAEFLNDIVSEKEVSSFIARAYDAPDEIRGICHYDRVVVCHAGEGHIDWNRNPDGSFSFRPIGSAGKALHDLASIIYDMDKKNCDG